MATVAGAILPPQANTVAPLLEAVRQFQDVAIAVRNAAHNMKTNKGTSRKISKVVQEIATCVETSVQRTYHGGFAPPVWAVLMVLDTAKGVCSQCAETMNTAAARDIVLRAVLKRSTRDSLDAFYVACVFLRDLICAEDNTCRLLEDPLRSIGVTPATCTKETIMVSISTADAMYDGFKSSLNVMVQITDGLIWPLKAVPQTILALLKCFEDYRGVSARITRLLARQETLWNIMADFHNQHATNPTLLWHVERFLEIQLRTIIQLRIIQAVRPVKRFISTPTMETVIYEAADHLLDAAAALKLAFSTVTTKMVERIEQKMDQVQQQLSGIQEGVQGLTPIGAEFNDFLISATPPPRPVVVHGRDEIIDEAIDKLTTGPSTRLAYLGAGGIGKTCVALSILHDERLVGIFADRRLFISCEVCAGAGTVVVTLAKLLCVSNSRDLLTAVVMHLRTSQRTLLILDNLETTWLVDNHSHRHDFERVLGTLALIPSLSLIVTCRGIILPIPATVQWSNSDSATLEPFTHAAARRTFLDICGTKVNTAEDTALDELIHEVDAMPLAVELLGTLALDGRTPTELLAEWKRSYGALLRTHNDRLHSVEASIAISITLLLQGVDGAEALRLLSVCSQLPDGLRPVIYEQLRPLFEHIDNARTRLKALALVSVGVDQQLKMLAPVRHYMLSHHPMIPIHAAALRSIYYDLAAKCPTGPSQDFAARAAVIWPEFNNLIAILLTLVPEPTQALVDAVVGISWFSYHYFPTVNLLTAIIPHVSDRDEWCAVSLRLLGRLRLSLYEHERALECLSAACEIYQRLGASAEVAACVRLKGKVHRLAGNNDAAMQSLHIARNMYHDLGDDLGQAKCLHELGQQYSRNNDLPAALVSLTAALLRFAALGHDHSAARSRHALGVAYLRQGDMTSAVEHLQGARTELFRLGDRHSFSAVTHELGYLYLRKRDLTLAERYFNDARELHESQANRFGLAESARAIGQFCRAQGRLHDARSNFAVALRLYEAQGLHQRAEECTRLLARAEANIQSQLSDASTSKLLPMTSTSFITTAFPTQSLPLPSLSSQPPPSPSSSSSPPSFRAFDGPAHGSRSSRDGRSSTGAYATSETDDDDDDEAVEAHWVWKTHVSDEDDEFRWERQSQWLVDASLSTAHSLSVWNWLHLKYQDIGFVFDRENMRLGRSLLCFVFFFGIFCFFF